MSLRDHSLESDVRDLILRLLQLHDTPPSTLARVDVPAWDSLKHMEIIFALEDRYRVQFDESEFASLDTPAGIAAALEKRLAT
jgi:acyl carrier protein